MKTNTLKMFKRAIALFAAVPILFLSSCEDEPVPDPIASFQYEISDANFLEVVFTNYSQDADSYSWDFGDGESSTEENPTHAFSEAGNYTVILTATNADDVSATFQESIEIVDPNEAIKLLTGEVSKTWKLYREGVSMSFGPNSDNPAGNWAGLENDGSRPCLYNQEFTFYLDGTYEFEDNGMFWGEYGVFNETDRFEVCFEAIAANMINQDGVDVSAWLSGTHTFEYNPSAGTVTLTGEGAWIGIPKLGTDAETTVPVSSVTFNVDITQETGYDLMTVTFDWGDGTAGGAGLWTIVYVSYSDPSLEPDLVTEAEPFGEDLADIIPSEIKVTFASRDAADLVTIDTVNSGSSVVFGVDDPLDGAAAKVGQFIRTAGVQYQELQFRAAPEPKDIQFDNFTTAKIDVYVPASTVFAEGGLQRYFVFGFADISQTDGWWNSPTQFETADDDVVLGAWTTYTFDLTDVKARADLDMIFLGMGGGGHSEGGTFYVRNLIFE
jgi:PKD repeat protein